MSRRTSRTGLVNPVTAPNDKSVLWLPPKWKAGAGHGIIFCHGRSGGASQMLTNPAAHIQALVDAGNAVLGLDLTGPFGYGHPSAVKTFDEGATYLISTVGVAGTRIGGFPWSMGGLPFNSWAVRNPTKVACSVQYSPALDLDWFHGGSAVGYTPGFTLASTGLPTTGEIDTAYTNVGANTGAATTTANGAATVPASGGAGVAVPMTTTINFADPSTKGSDSRASQVTIGGVLCTYTGVSSTQLLGVVSTTASTVAVSNGTVVSTNYTNNSPGYDPMKRRADFSTVPGQHLIVHPSDDVTVPPAASDWFATGAGGGYSVLSPKPTGGHSGSFFNVPVTKTLDVFQSATYT